MPRMHSCCEAVAGINLLAGGFFFNSVEFLMSFILVPDICFKTIVQATSLVYPRRTAASILNNSPPTCEHDSPNLTKNEQKLMKIALF